MKYITILGLLFSMNVFASPVCTKDLSTVDAEEQMEIKTDVPNHLKGATITVKLADGRESTVPAENFKVVPRKQQFLVTKTVSTEVFTCTVAGENQKNRVSLLGGHGAKEGLNVSRDESTGSASVESRVGLVGGLQYQRLVFDQLSLGIQGQTNKTGSLLIGLDF